MRRCDWYISLYSYVALLLIEDSLYFMRPMLETLNNPNLDHGHPIEYDMNKTRLQPEGYLAAPSLINDMIVPKKLFNSIKRKFLKATDRAVSGSNVQYPCISSLFQQKLKLNASSTCRRCD